MAIITFNERFSVTNNKRVGPLLTNVDILPIDYTYRARRYDFPSKYQVASVYMISTHLAFIF